MIRTLFLALRSPQLFLPLAVFVLGVFLLSTAWGVYTQKANRPLPDAHVQPGSKEVPSVRELRSMLSESPAEKDENLDMIAEKNLFTPQREAWQPPPKEDPDQDGQGQENGRSSNEAAGRVREIHRSKIRLYGTAMTDSGKNALMYMDPFQTDNKHFVAHEGDVLRDAGQRGKWLFFRVISIRRNSVALEDPGGETFDVGLYDQQPKNAQKPSPRDTSGLHITVGGDQVPLDPDRAEGGKKDAPGSENVERTAPRADRDVLIAPGREKAEPGSADQSKAQTSPEHAQGAGKQGGSQSLQQALEGLGGQESEESGESLSAKERKQQVEEGKMQKIETPFGTIYRPVQESSQKQ